MGLSRGNPLAIEAVGDIQVDIDGQVKRLAMKIDEADRSRSNWIEKQKRLLEQRRGVRRPKNIPWPGANNDNWPITDAVIRRWKPGMANLVLRSDPVALFDARVPQYLDSAKSAQEFYHWLFTSHIDSTALTVMELTDLIAQHGKAYSRQGWEYRTERQSRIARVDSLFPQGIEAALEETNAAIAQQNQQLPEGRQRAALDPQTFVEQVLLQEYRLDPVVDAEVATKAAAEILQGARYVRLIYQEVVCDRPAWRALSPLDVVVPPRSDGIQNAEFVCVIHRLSVDDILRRAKDGDFLPDAANEVAQKVGRHGMFGQENLSDVTGSRQSLSEVLDRVEGVSEEYSENIPLTPVWEIYSKLDIDGDGLAERVVLWYHDPSKTLLAAYEYPYPFRDWPIVEFDFEHNSKRPLGSRGIAEMLSTHQKQANQMHNARLDAAQVTLAPMFKVRSVGNHFMRNIKFRPGARIPVSDPRDIEPLVTDVRPITEFFREEQFTKSLAEQYIGIFDPSLTQLQGTGRERRTATEVDAVVAQASEIQAQDAQLFQLSMARVHKQLWDLWEEYGPEEIYARVTGEEQPQLVEKAMISGEYDITPAGSPISTNRAIILQRARELVQVALQDQSGLLNKHEAFREYVSAHDFQLAERLVRSPEEAAAIQQLLQGLQTVNEMNGNGSRSVSELAF